MISRTIILSATVTPPQNTPMLKRVDPLLRMQDYKKALKFYIDLPDEVVDRIVFVDNSNSDLSELESMLQKEKSCKNIELISFDGNNHPVNYGKGYGEFKLLDYAVTNSNLLKSDDIIWKVTGRLRVLNISKLIQTSPKSYNLYCDLRNAPLVGHSLGGNQWMDLRLFSCSVGFYKTFFLEKYRDLNENTTGKSPEQVLYPIIKELKSSLIYKRFKRQPIISGVGGHRNKDYRSVDYRMKELFRIVNRFAFPWLWF